jgi:hypothetical protein
MRIQDASRCRYSNACAKWSIARDLLASAAVGMTPHGSTRPRAATIANLGCHAQTEPRFAQRAAAMCRAQDASACAPRASAWTSLSSFTIRVRARPICDEKSDLEAHTSQRPARSLQAARRVSEHARACFNVGAHHSSRGAPVRQCACRSSLERARPNEGTDHSSVPCRAMRASRPLVFARTSAPCTPRTSTVQVGGRGRARASLASDGVW